MDGSSDEKKHVNDNENLCPDRPDDLQNIPRRQRLIRILARLDQAFFNFPLFSDHLTEISNFDFGTLCHYSEKYQYQVH